MSNSLHQSLDRRVAVALLAHPDDAEILCTGTLIHLADRGWEVHIATVTAGDCGSSTLPREEIADIRRREAAGAAAQIGATYHCLEENDVNVVFDRTSIRKAIDLLRQINPTLVCTHQRHDYMLDHEQVHLLARSATFSFPIPNASELALAATASILWLYYCDPIKGLDPYSGERVRPSTYVDITSVMSRKVEMLRCHASQREWLRSHHGTDEYVEAMKQHGAVRGEEIGVMYAEAFVQHRGHAYPHTDLLADLLGGTLPYGSSD